MTVAACVGLLWVGTAQAVLTAEQKCEQAKLKAQGALQRCLEEEQREYHWGQDRRASATCQMKFMTVLATADAHATKAGTSCRYLDNMDGTVSDLNTGLVWEQKVVGGIRPFPLPHESGRLLEIPRTLCFVEVASPGLARLLVWD